MESSAKNAASEEPQQARLRKKEKKSHKLKKDDKKSRDSGGEDADGGADSDQSNNSTKNETKTKNSTNSSTSSSSSSSSAVPKAEATKKAIKKKKRAQREQAASSSASSTNKRHPHQKLVTRASEYKSFKQQRIHELQDSLFSSTSNYRDFSGFMNLALILLVISNTRMFLENLMKYGLLVDPVQWVSLFIRDPYSWPNAALLAFAYIYILLAFSIERILAKRLIPESLGLLVHCLNLACLLIIPAYFTWIGHPPPTASCLLLVAHAALFCKLYSYAQTNKWYRQGIVEADKLDRSTYFESYDTDENESVASRRGVGRDRPVKYPENVTIRNLYYFVVAPTLCYEANFPRTNRIRPYFLLKRLCEMIFLLQLILGSIQQWIIPTIMNSKKPLTQMNWFHLTERLLKLAVPNHICWLMGFYCVFHSQLNLIAELLRFGDRQFYMDWWNSESITRFWRTWNIPVHRFCVRHVYCPLIECGLSRQLAGLAVFLISAFFHEYFISVPLKMFRAWAFVGMAAQVPLSLLVDSKIKGRWANIIVWLAIIMGQPLAEMMYFHDLLYRDAPEKVGGGGKFSHEALESTVTEVFQRLFTSHVFLSCMLSGVVFYKLPSSALNKTNSNATSTDDNDDGVTVGSIEKYNDAISGAMMTSDKATNTTKSSASQRRSNRNRPAQHRRRAGVDCPASLHDMAQLILPVVF